MLGRVVKQQAKEPNIHTGPVVASIVQRPGEQDAAYIVHAANAYPKLVEALRFAMKHTDNVFALANRYDREIDEYKKHGALLRSLGESEEKMNYLPSAESRKDLNRESE
jgi:hypothetical protein